MSNLVEVKYDAPDLPVVGAAIAAARALVVDSQEMYEFADGQLVDVKRRWKAVEEQRVAIVDPLNKAKTAVQKLFTPVLDDLATAETHYKQLMLGFRREQDKIRQAEQARLDEIARKERERLEKQAVRAEDKGQVEKASMLTATAAVISAPIATSTYVEQKGISVKKTWKAEVTDKVALINAIIANPAFLNIIEIDSAALDRLAKATEGNIPLAGVRTFQEESMARRAA